MSNFLLNVLKGGRNELSRLTDDNTSLAWVGGVGSVLSVSMIILIIFLYKHKWDYAKIPMMILFYISLYIIVVSLGFGFLNLPLKTDRDTNLFVGNLQLIFRVIVIPILIIMSLIGAKIPRDKGESYYEYMITHLLQSETLKTNMIKFGLIALPLVYGLIEVATNGGNFTSLSTYYISIASIIGFIIVGVMKLIGGLMNLMSSDRNITNNLDKKQSIIVAEVVAEVIVLFTTIITILTNMTQRVEGLIFSSVILVLMLIGVLFVSTPKNKIGIIAGIVLIICVIIVQIFLHLTIFKQENTTEISDITTLETNLTTIQKELAELKETINNPGENSKTINKMRDTINGDNKYKTDDIDIIFDNYKNLTIKSQEYMVNLVEIKKKINTNKLLARDDREEKMYEDKLSNYTNLLNNNKIEERGILQEFVNITNEMDTLMKSYNTYFLTTKAVKDAETARTNAQAKLNELKAKPDTKYTVFDTAQRDFNTANSAYDKLIETNHYPTDHNKNKKVNTNDKVTIYKTKQDRLNNLDTIYQNLDTDEGQQDNGILEEQKANIDLILYFVSIGGFILGIKSIR